MGVAVDLRKDPDVLARVLEEFDPSGTQEIFHQGQVGLRRIGWVKDSGGEARGNTNWLMEIR